VDPLEFINHEGAELLLVGARENAEQEMGIEFRPDAEEEHTAGVLPRAETASGGAPLRRPVEVTLRLARHS
jgi:hypothetical protein